jgi:hypothetical protein
VLEPTVTGGHQLSRHQTIQIHQSASVISVAIQASGFVGKAATKHFVLWDEAISPASEDRLKQTPDNNASNKRLVKTVPEQHIPKAGVKWTPYLGPGDVEVKV